MSFFVIIPARFASSRLPGKPLLPLAGKPMVQHVYEQCLKSRASEVVVATDDERILNAVIDFGGKAVMTAADHASGTDRLQEVATQLHLPDDAIVVNVQGDEPLIPADTINQVAENLMRTPRASVATLYEPINQWSDFTNPNIVKVVARPDGLALYFSRAPIPWDRDRYQGGEVSLSEGSQCFRHIGLYAYRVGLLHQFVGWPMGALEQIEKLEQLRVLENGHAIHLAEACESFEGGVDTPADLERVSQLLAAQNPQ